MKKNLVWLREFFLCVNNDFIEINSFGHLERYFIFKSFIDIWYYWLYRITLFKLLNLKMASELPTVTSILSKEESQYQIDIFMHCCKIIGIILYSGHLYCWCDFYSGCQTEIDFITNTKKYCCICQFSSLFDTITLHQIKRDTHKIRSYYGEILKVVCKAKILDCNDFWDEDVMYSVESEAICEFFNFED